ncbi:hypothetical protein HYFRA_00010097 [Hymenoscyphus fraxineus]|uniref:Rhodopsin domain-containing protein n=1 Tax=Hymenoscyphus fraxineus TaxID=746836 RepID=A0A9N9KVZ5_9HELO|nr:hypothetical protein HYFRA_00010097 [Hymenoscyphus fraxineus]
MSFDPTNIPPELMDMLPPELQMQLPLYDQTVQPKIRATLAVCTVIAYIALGLRLWARRITRQSCGPDDLFAGFAVVFTTIGVGLQAHLTSLGIGRHEIVMVVEHIEDFDALNKTIIASSSIALYALTAILVLTISCLPPMPPTLEEPIAQLKCSDHYLIDTVLVILITNVALDAIILCLPLPLIWHLQTNLRKKLQLSFVFTLGSFIFIISILRVVAVKRLNPLDDNWDSTDVELWSTAESAVGIIVVSLPLMQPLLLRVFYRKDGTSRMTATPKTISDPNKNDDSGGPIALLTFGRSGMKGPSARKPRGLDVTTVGTVTLADNKSSTNFDGSATRLVSEDQSSRTIEPTES